MESPRVSSQSSDALLIEPKLSAIGVEHGFGTRHWQFGESVLRPRQVHGVAIAELRATGELSLSEADAVVSTTPGVRVGIATADCVPILVCGEDGLTVAAIHAGWRGLAAGVVEAGVTALRKISVTGRLIAAIGPHIGDCCYEIDGPVIEALESHFGSDASAAWGAPRAGHAQLRLEKLVVLALAKAGLASGDVGTAAASCTRCDADRFHSYRRDLDRSGRLIHFIAARGT
jgi:YfiH family protein